VWEPLADYHSSGAAELAWARAADAWQTAVAGVSLPGLKGLISPDVQQGGERRR